MTREETSEIRSAVGLMALQSIRGIGPKKALRMALWADAPVDAPTAWPRLLAAARAELDDAGRQGIRAISIFEGAYPERLRAIPDPPPVLFVKGAVDALRAERVVAVVGTREPSEFGCSATEAIVAALARHRWAVVSGLAKGIDTIAHGAALKHHTPTAAVMAGGLDRIYPKTNEEMARAIVDRAGALVSEQRVGHGPTRAAFVQRNRIQSGLAAALVVTQTGLTGGTMHTVRHAAAQGRPIFCAEPHARHQRSEGLRVLLETPANRLCEALPAWKDAAGLCARLGPEPLARPISKANLDALPEALERVLAGDSQRNPESRWWPEAPPAAGPEGDVIAPDRAGTLRFTFAGPARL